MRRLLTALALMLSVSISPLYGQNTPTQEPKEPDHAFFSEFYMTPILCIGGSVNQRLYAKHVIGLHYQTLFIPFVIFNNFAVDYRYYPKGHKLSLSKHMRVLPFIRAGAMLHKGEAIIQNTDLYPYLGAGVEIQWRHLYFRPNLLLSYEIDMTGEKRSKGFDLGEVKLGTIGASLMMTTIGVRF